MKRLRILLVDDHAVVREGLKRVLEAQADLELVGEAENGEDALALVAQLGPDLVLMDLSMPGLGGIEATRRLVAAAPGTGVIALTVHEGQAYVTEFLKSGAQGYLLKRATTDELLRAVRTVGEGKVYVDARVSRALVENLIAPRHAGGGTKGLSDRETEVLRLIALGYANKEIADQMGVSVKSIETYKARAMEKLDLRSRVDIVQLAQERGWFTDKRRASEGA